MTQNTIDAVVAAYEAVHPEVSVDVFRAPTGELAGRIAAEQRAGKIGGDVFWMTDPLSIQGYASQGLLADWTPSQAADLDPGYVGDGYWGTRLLNMVMVKGSDLTPGPATWKDLLDPAYKDAVAIPDPGFAGSAFGALGYFTESPEFGMDFYQALKANGAVQVKAPDDVTTGVAEGRFKAGMTLDNSARTAAGKGSPVALVWPTGGAIAIYSPIAVVKSSENPSAAESFVDFVLSPEGQAAIGTHRLGAGQGRRRRAGAEGPQVKPDWAAPVRQAGRAAHRLPRRVRWLIRRDVTGPRRRTAAVAGSADPRAPPAGRGGPRTAGDRGAGGDPHRAAGRAAGGRRARVGGRDARRDGAEPTRPLGHRRQRVDVRGRRRPGGRAGHGGGARHRTAWRARGAGGCASGVLAALLVPPFVNAYGWARAFGPRGLLDRWLGDSQVPGLYGPLGIVLVLTVAATPLVWLIVAGALASRVEPDAERAARASGAGPWDVLRSVTLPAPATSATVGVRRGVRVRGQRVRRAVCLGTPAGFATITTRLYQEFALSASPVAFVRAITLALTLVVLAVAVVGAADALLAGRSASRTGAAAGSAGRGRGRWLVTLVMGGLLVLFVGVPLVALVLQALTKAAGLAPVPANWTLANFQAALDARFRDGLVNSLLLATAAATVVSIIGSLGAVATRGRARGLGTVVALGFAVPGSALAVAMLLAFGGPLRDTLLLILVAYVAKFWALGHRQLAGYAGAPAPGAAASRPASGAAPGTPWGRWRRLCCGRRWSRRGSWCSSSRSTS